jgi:putative transcriptional regulator
LKLGNHLRRCRFEHDEITQQALANAVGVTRLTIHSIEKCKFVPSTLLALKLAQFFQKPVEEIFFIIKENRDMNSSPDHKGI